MKKLSKTGKYIDLNEYKIHERFEVYDLDGYDFTENLDFGEDAGVYIFSKRQFTSTESNKFKRQVYYHTPLYCGMTENFNQRFDGHFKAEDLINAHCNRICICYCNCKEDAKDLEQRILSSIDFPFNSQNNKEPKNSEEVKLTEV